MVGDPHLVSHPGFGTEHPVMHGLTGNPNVSISRHLSVPFLNEAYYYYVSDVNFPYKKTYNKKRGIIQFTT